MADIPSTRGERAAGVVLHRLPAAGGAFVLVCAVSAAVLAPLHLWRWWVAVPAVLALTALSLRRVAALPAPPVPLWSFGCSLLASVGYAAWTITTHGEQVVVRRDAGSYALYAQWLATRNGLPVDVSLDAFGGAAALSDPHFGVGSAAFYGIVQHAGSAEATATVVPQFVIGAPATMSLGWWATGWWGSGPLAGLLGVSVVASLVGALAVLAAAALTTRVVGARWAPLAAATLALAQPVVHVGRGTYSEPFALLLMLVTGCLVHDAIASWPSGLTSASPPGAVRAVEDRVRRLAWTAGLYAGLTGLVRVDAVREVALLLPVWAVLRVCGHPAAAPLLKGLSIGLAVSVSADWLLSAPYLRQLAGSLLPLVVLALAVGAGSWAFTVWCRRRGGLPRGPSWLPDLAGAAVLGAGLLMAARPLFLVVRQDAADPGAFVVAGLQAAQGLAVDGGRTYAEHSVAWIFWYLGPVTPVLALLVAAAAARRGMVWWRDPGRTVPAWFALLFVGGASSLAVLWRPGITPDHPWADRRLVPVVLPFVVVCATAAVAWATREARRRLPVTVLVAVTVGGVLCLVVPAAAATWPHATLRTERGEPAAVRQLCGALRPGDVVIMIDTRAAHEWTQVVRGVCGHPAGVLKLSEDERSGPRLPVVASAVPALARRVEEAGGRPVLMTVESDLPLLALGLEPRRVVRLVTAEDQKLLTRRPDGSLPLVLEVWLAPWDATEPAATG